jgi:WD40 repeat protein
VIDLRNLPLSTKQIQYTLTGPTDQVVSCAISPGGWTALTASYDCTARIWDLASRPWP